MMAIADHTTTFTGRLAPRSRKLKDPIEGFPGGRLGEYGWFDGYFGASKRFGLLKNVRVWLVVGWEAAARGASRPLL